MQRETTPDDESTEPLTPRRVWAAIASPLRVWHHPRTEIAHLETIESRENHEGPGVMVTIKSDTGVPIGRVIDSLRAAGYEVHYANVWDTSRHDGFEIDIEAIAPQGGVEA